MQVLFDTTSNHCPQAFLPEKRLVDADLDTDPPDVVSFKVLISNQAQPVQPVID